MPEYLYAKVMYLPTVKSRAVDRSTIQFWTFLAKVHSTQESNFHFINSLKILECATNGDSLLLVTLRYIAEPSKVYPFKIISHLRIEYSIRENYQLGNIGQFGKLTENPINLKLYYSILLGQGPLLKFNFPKT